MALLVASSAVAACSGSSKTNGGSGGGEEAGRGGGAGRGGAAGSGAASGASGGGSASGGDGTGGVMSGGAGDGTGANSGGAAGSDGEPSGGMSGTGATAGGAAGDGASSAGESSGGAGGCHDLCSTEAPACCAPGLECVAKAPSCRIDVLADTVGVIYEYEDLEAELEALSGTVQIAIPLAEVASAAADPSPAARLEMTLTAELSDALAAEGDLAGHPFRLSCDERELFVGVVYFMNGAAALQTPVLHIEQADGGALALRLGAVQGAWLLGGDGTSVALRERIDRDELRAAFCERGILNQLQEP